MGSACEPSIPYRSQVWCCTMLLGPALHDLLDAAPYGPELFVPDPDATIEHVDQGGEWESYRWTGELQPAIQREVWSTRDLPPAYQEPDRIVWCAYSGGDDEYCDDAFDTLDEALAWLRERPACEWVEACEATPRPDCSEWIGAEGYEWTGGLSFVVVVRQPLTCHPGGLRHVATVAGDDVESSWCLVDARPATADELARLATALGVSRG